MNEFQQLDKIEESHGHCDCFDHDDLELVYHDVDGPILIMTDNEIELLR